MTNQSLPVTFHMRAEPRPELFDEEPRRARPYIAIVQLVGVLTVIGVGFGFFAGQLVPVSKVGGAPPPPTSASAEAPSFPIWRPAPGQSLPTVAASPASGLGETPGVDYTPVASIPVTGAGRSPAFAPVERAPDYSGFRVTAGQ
jgi:hypothetical protein